MAEPPLRPTDWCRIEALAFDGRWYSCRVVWPGPRTPRVTSACGEVGLTVRLRLHYPAGAKDRAARLAFALALQGWQQVELHESPPLAPGG